MDPVHLVSALHVNVRGSTRWRDGGVRATLEFLWDGAPIFTHSGNLSDGRERQALAINLAGKTGAGEQEIRTALAQLEGDLADQSGGDAAPTTEPSTISAVDLFKLDLPEPRWAVPGVLPEGLTILASRPKLGKTAMACGLGVSIASGAKALGEVPVDAGDVLPHDASGAEVQVADLAVAHHAVRQPHVAAHALQGGMRAGLPERVHGGRARLLDRVERIAGVVAPAVHDDEDDGPGDLHGLPCLSDGAAHCSTAASYF